MVDLKAQHMESMGYAIDYGLRGWGLNPIQGHMAGMSVCIIQRLHVNVKENS